MSVCYDWCFELVRIPQLRHRCRSAVVVDLWRAGLRCRLHSSEYLLPRFILVCELYIEWGICVIQVSLLSGFIICVQVSRLSNNLLQIPDVAYYMRILIFYYWNIHQNKMPPSCAVLLDMLLKIPSVLENVCFCWISTYQQSVQLL
jgi:hypothetical protein